VATLGLTRMRIALLFAAIAAILWIALLFAAIAAVLWIAGEELAQDDIGELSAAFVIVVFVAWILQKLVHEIRAYRASRRFDRE